jgi:hypothetical protein
MWRLTAQAQHEHHTIRLESLQKTKGKFSSSLSHDGRYPSGSGEQDAGEEKGHKAHWVMSEWDFLGFFYGHGSFEQCLEGFV